MRFEHRFYFFPLLLVKGNMIRVKKPAAAANYWTVSFIIE